jgi:hypothetical protein
MVWPDKLLVGHSMRIAFVGSLALAAVVAAAAQAQPGSSVFPMEKGTSWIYAGWVAWQEGSRLQLTWKSEVLDSVERGTYKVALVLGDPRDLTWYSETTKRGCYLLMAVDDREFYLRRPASGCVLPQRGFSDLARGVDLFLRLPARVGDVFGADPETKRRFPDGRYAWCVDDRGPVSLAGIKGVPQERPFTAYTLMFRTNPDHQIATYVPGIGLTSYVYSHHGTVSEVDMRLVEFHNAARRD